MQYQYIPINKELTPYYFEILLNNELFKLQINYNSSADFFTVDLYKNDELVCAGEPIVYGVQLWGDMYQKGKYPNLKIVPFDESDESNAVTYDNINSTVYLAVIGEIENE